MDGNSTENNSLKSRHTLQYVGRCPDDINLIYEIQFLIGNFVFLLLFCGTSDDDLLENLVHQSIQARNIRAMMRLSMRSTSLPFLFVIPHKVLEIELLWLTENINTSKTVQFNYWKFHNWMHESKLVQSKDSKLSLF